MMQNEDLVPVIESKCSSEDNEDLLNPVQDEVIVNDIPNEILINSDDGTSPIQEDGIFMDPLNDSPENGVENDLPPNDEHITAETSKNEVSEDEYVYLSNEECNALDSDEGSAVDTNAPPGPKSRKRELIEDQSIKSVVDTAVVIPILENEEREPESEIRLDAIKCRDANEDRSPRIDEVNRERLSREQRRLRRACRVQPAEPAIPVVEEKNEKDFFETPLNAPFVDTSSDEDYFQPFHAEHRKVPGTSRRERVWTDKLKSSLTPRQKNKKKSRIPDDVYFNSKVPLHVLYSYEESTSGEEESTVSTAPTPSTPNISAPPIRRTKRCLTKMPPVFKIEAKSNKTKPIIEKKPIKPTVFQQLNDLKRFYKASGIKISLNQLVKGSQTFHERCDRIRKCLYENGIRGRLTLAKCKQLKKQMKLKRKLETTTPIIKTEDDKTSIQESIDSVKTEQNPEITALPEKINDFKCEDNLDPTNIVEAIFGENQSNAETIDQILNNELPNDLINEPIEYFEHVRNI